MGGKFGERFGEIAKAYGMNPIIHNVEWGKSFKVSEIEKILKENPDIKAVNFTSLRDKYRRTQPR